MPDPQSPQVLVVDDDAAVCWALERALVKAGWRVAVAADVTSARRRIKHGIDLVLTDIRMPGESGLDLLASLRADRPDLPVLVMTAHGTVETAMAAIGHGAFDYLPKPLDLDRTIAAVRRALGETPLAASARPASGFDEAGIVGGSPAMQEVYRRLAAAAGSDVEVLFIGPAGSGKKALAHALHQHGSRHAGPFVHVACATLGDSTSANELATFAATAADGLLFLEEIDGLCAQGQAALLGILDAPPPRPRLIASSRRDLAQLAGFREDLAWRLASVRIAVPALTERLDDLAPLVRAFLARSAARLGRELAITDAALARIATHTWPGNVRELKYVIEQACVMAVGGVVDAEHLPIGSSATPASAVPAFAAATAHLARRLFDSAPGQVHAQALDELESVLVHEALARTGGNQLRAAELLGINRATLKKRMDQAGLGR
jgi:DNA-binding NtrC family response regulator